MKADDLESLLETAKIEIARHRRKHNVCMTALTAVYLSLLIYDEVLIIAHHVIELPLVFFVVA